MTEITLDLPAPPPINRLRRINWANHRLHIAWRANAGNFLLVAKSGGKKVRLSGSFEIDITVDTSVKSDLDAVVKSVIDFCVVYCVVPDDSPKYLRKITLQWGSIPEGIRVVLRDFPA